MTKKMTKKEMFAEIIVMAEGGVLTKALPTEIIEFAQHEIELLENRSGKSGMSKNQKENEVLVEQLYSALVEIGKPVTISEFQKESNSEVATLSNQRISALLKKLMDADRVVRTIEKKKAYFSVVQDGE